MSMTPVTFRPLGVWQDGPDHDGRRRSQFSATFTATMELLDRELRQLGAEHVVIQIDVTEADIRLDGWPRSNARPDHPGVVLLFESKYGPLRYATDRFRSWQENLRAIALGLEALRKVDRYGITKSGEQYTGWKQLTAGTSDGVSSRDEARSILASFSDYTAGQVEDGFFARAAYRQAIKRAHPDGGGSTEFFTQVQAAAEILGLREKTA